MASNINTSAIDDNYPYAGVNQSSQGFRDNFRSIKNNLTTAGNEISSLQTKQISITGDATGISGQLGAGNTQPAAINLVLSTSGVVAGTYDTVNKSISLSVDSKGRVVSLTTTPTPTRPSVVGDAAPVITSTPALGNATQIDLPILSIDQYGTVTAVSSLTAKFGIKDHPLAKGSLLVGTTQGVSAEFPLPNESFSNADIWTLSWNPIFGGAYGVQWRKLPPIIDNPAKVIAVQPGPGVSVDATDENNPIVRFDASTMANYGSTVIQNNLEVITFNPALGTSTKIPFNQLAASVGPTGLTALIDDPAPTLGGNLNTNGFKITGQGGGVTIETTVNGPVIINGQTMPNQAGVDGATMTIDGSGRMYWNPPAPVAAVTQVNGGNGISTLPSVGITGTGSVNLDYTNLPVGTPQANETIAYQSVTGMKKFAASSLMMLNNTIVFVDPFKGNDVVGAGTMTNPFKTIAFAQSNVTADINGVSKIILYPGIYSDGFTVNKSNVEFASMFVNDTVICTGKVFINAGLKRTIFTRIRFDISNSYQDPTTLAIEVANGCDSITFNECDFLRFADEFDRSLPIVKMTGAQNGDVRFIGCKFSGKIINNLAPVTTDVEYGLYITEAVTNNNARIGLETSGTSHTVLSFAEVVDYIDHKGGYLELNSINQITGNYTDDDLESMDDPEDDPADYGFKPIGILSTATNNNDNALVLNNVYSGIATALGTLFTPIKKTGTAKYQFTNVTRDSNIDEINGVRIRVSSPLKVDSFNPVKVSTGTAISIDVLKDEAYNVNLTANTALNFVVPNMLDVLGYKEAIIILKQDATGNRNVTFNTTAPATIKIGTGAVSTTGTTILKVKYYDNVFYVSFEFIEA